MGKDLDEVALVFESLEYRSLVEDQRRLLDRVSVRDYVCNVEIGAFQAERNCTQRIKFNVILEITKSDAGFTDDVDDVLSYELITESIDKSLLLERMNLLETLAERIAEKCLDEPRVLRSFIRIEKLDRIPGKLGVEIVRSREHLKSKISLSNTTDDVGKCFNKLDVIYMPNDVLAGNYLENWVEVFCSSDRAIIICLDPIATSVGAARTSEAKNRIRLLSIEQNAWFFASLDSRLTVVSNKTELDWVKKNNKAVVWSPSKIIVDSFDRIEISSDSWNLACWLATKFEADRVVRITIEKENFFGNAQSDPQNFLSLRETDWKNF